MGYSSYIPAQKIEDEAMSVLAAYVQKYKERNGKTKYMAFCALTGGAQKQRFFLCCQRRLQFEYAMA